MYLHLYLYVFSGITVLVMRCEGPLARERLKDGKKQQRDIPALLALYADIDVDTYLGWFVYVYGCKLGVHERET